ncbi:L-lysine 6-monooxygenase (NADPH-requiring)-domain-containing protein [Immersiella caudata]|uniref:L-ornithine N(5)-monooxygenase [NAD(P)H] n=1 Tax=Immersiella caudata TaxID=314043 RepID=A0AA40BXU1_9PEZI|nr:L-lysine 6-monooxygenase (NADPH-requiring)-domain-containing protein [Immersiella caudata]
MSPHFDTDTMGNSASVTATEQIRNGPTADVIDPTTHQNGTTHPVKPMNGVVNGFHDDVPELVNGAVAPVAEGPAVVHTEDNTVTKSPFVRPATPDSVYDLVCIGFGPASVAIAIALHDEMEAGRLKTPPKVLFLEKQAQFAWHAGMLLPGAKMQISFIKDLASLRNPRSNFTFLNYLHKNNRLVEFTNLDTFTPARVEFEDYLRWCARHFDDAVKYQNEVVSVAPVKEDGPLETFTVKSRNAISGEIASYTARNVVLALGGQASMPKMLPAKNPRVIHSSQYAQHVPKLLSDSSAPYRVAVVGAGQSAAEIFNNVQNLYPNSKTYLIMRSEFLRPSDDSPFVNSIFNPEYIDRVYPRSSEYRAALLEDARATNYSVVRLELIEHLYEKMYHQRRTLGVDEKKWPHRILAGRKLVNINEKGDKLQLKVALSLPGEAETQDGPLLEEEDLEVDLIICATGYQRRAHVDMLKDIWPLLPESTENGSVPVARKDRWLVETEDARQRVLEVSRNYAVRFTPGAVAPEAGVWLQGCCEATHGVSVSVLRDFCKVLTMSQLSDTLLSVLSTRSGEMVGNIFGKSAGSK